MPFGSDSVQLWVQLWFERASGVVQIWFRLGPKWVQIWFSFASDGAHRFGLFGSGLGQVQTWFKLWPA